MSRVLVLHGWTYRTDQWEPILRFLADKKVTAEMLKVPGLTDGTDRVWTLDDYVAWLKAKVGDETVTLIGHSNGGRISLAFAARYPTQVNRLVLIDSAGIPPKGWKIQVKRAVFGTAAKLGKKVTNSPKLRSLLYKAARESDYKNATPAMRQTMANLLAADLEPELPHIQAPTQLIWGALDTATPLKDGELMAARIPQAKLHVIPDAKHSPQITHVELVGTWIVEALS